MSWLAALGLAGCSASGSRAIALQFVDVHDGDVPNEAYGVALYGLGDEDAPVGLFVELHGTSTGNVEGTHLSDPPITANLDPLTGRQVRSGVVHFGPCLRATDWLHFYVGGGVGYSREYVERFNPTVSTQPSGLYYYGESSDFGGSVSAGVLLEPLPGVLLGAGYESWFEGIVMSLGWSF